MKKESGSGLFENERLLLIKSGFISYFSKRPKTYVGNIRSLEISGDLPKQTLPVTSISDVKIDNRFITFKFNTSELIDQETLNSMVNQKSLKEKKK